VGLACLTGDHSFELDGVVPILNGQPQPTGRRSPITGLHQWLLGSPRLYDIHQAVGGGFTIADQVRSTLADTSREVVLDVGAGTGMVARILPPTSRYVWLDNDVLKLKGFRSKNVDAHAVLGDASNLPFRDAAADCIVMVEVSHHLDDEALARSLEEAARVTRRRFVFVDALRGSRLRSRLLWQLDLGRFPRSEEQLLSALSVVFELEAVEHFRINHDHLLCIGLPRRTARSPRDAEELTI
jgi:SAM-dependent methyltransferase